MHFIILITGLLISIVGCQKHSDKIQGNESNGTARENALVQPVVFVWHTNSTLVKLKFEIEGTRSLLRNTHLTAQWTDRAGKCTQTIYDMSEAGRRKFPRPSIDDEQNKSRTVYLRSDATESCTAIIESGLYAYLESNLTEGLRDVKLDQHNYIWDGYPHPLSSRKTEPHLPPTINYASKHIILNSRLNLAPIMDVETDEVFGFVVRSGPLEDPKAFSFNEDHKGGIVVESIALTEQDLVIQKNSFRLACLNDFRIEQPNVFKERFGIEEGAEPIYKLFALYLFSRDFLLSKYPEVGTCFI